MGGDEKNVSAKLDIIAGTGTWTDFFIARISPFSLHVFCLFYCFTSPSPGFYFFIARISLSIARISLSIARISLSPAPVSLHSIFDSEYLGFQ